MVKIDVKENQRLRNLIQTYKTENETIKILRKQEEETARFNQKTQEEMEKQRKQMEEQATRKMEMMELNKTLLANQVKQTQKSSYKEELEAQIGVKDHSIYIDEVKCVTTRQGVVIQAY